MLAAAQAFAEHGYTHASIARIVGSMELTEGAIYHHFKNKAELAVAVLEALYERWERARQEVTAEAEARDLDGLATIHLLNLTTARLYQKDVIVQASARLRHEREIIPAEFPTPYVGWFPFLDHHLRRAQDAGLADPDLDRAAAIRIILGSLMGIQDVSRRTSNYADLAGRIEEWWHLMLLGFSARS